MSRAQRLGLIALAVAVAAVAFVAIKPDGDDDKAGAPAADRQQGDPATTAERPTATTESRPEERISLRAHRPAGGVRRIEVRKGDYVRLTVQSDAPDQIHLHGYDLERPTEPGQPARFAFRANVEGVFELESHVAEDRGEDSLVARLVVTPS